MQQDKDSSSDVGVLKLTLGYKEHAVLYDPQGRVICRVKIGSKYRHEVPVVFQAPKDSVIIRRSAN